MMTIVDYGLGNIRAFVNVYERLNLPVKIVTAAADLKGASKIILPGVGAFDQAMKQLNGSGMRDELEKQVLGNKVPFIGICVGMQVLARSSEEGVLPGLGWIDGEVRKFDLSISSHKTVLPHMGWNTIAPLNGNALLNEFTERSRFYFLHSFFVETNDQNDTIATTEYVIRYTSALNHENIYGVQFHPEKSHRNGVQLLKNFADL